MHRQTMLKVDLGNADPGQTALFTNEMSSRGWLPIPEIPSAFCATLDCASDAEIVEASEEDATWSAELARIYDWDAVCIIHEDE